MAIALNKSSLKQQRDRLKLFQRFLPSLDLKRQQLMIAFKAAKTTLAATEAEAAQLESSVVDVLPLLGSSTLGERDLTDLVRMKSVKIEIENVVGAKLPIAREIEFEALEYSTLALPFFVDVLVEKLEALSRLRIRVAVERERVRLLDAAVRRITQRVNLFDKVLIPGAKRDIARIRIFLADEERAAVVRSKISKAKREASN